MKRRLWISLVLTVLVVLGALGANLASGNSPILGIDLAGGVSVILQTVDEDGESATADDLTIIRDLVRDELEQRGIAEPDVRVQGDTIVVDLPGVDDQQEAIDAVQVSGVVELRPVVNPTACQAASPILPLDEPLPTDGVTAPEATPTDDGTTDDAAGEASDASDDATTDMPTDTNVDEPDASVQPLRRPLAAPTTDEPVTTDAPPATDGPPATDAPTVTATSADDVPTVEPPTDLAPDGGEIPDLSDFQFDTGGPELLVSREGLPVCVGPDQNVDEVIVFARGGSTAQLIPNWGVTAELRSDGVAYWNLLAGQCFNRTATCPTGQLAIVLDGVVQSAPNVNQPVFDDQVSITGSFTEEEARSLASVLNRGAFPVQVEAEEARTVSASAGGDSLRAAVIAGLIGVALVLVFLLAYYRWFALVILGGLTIWGALVYSVATFVSNATNYALSLAGITGIIVAVGVTVDSYVVFFERMKDEIRNGRTMKNAGPRSFKVTWRTILSADLVSVIGAAILFWLSVGSVRGFALYLGITTLCDLVVCYFFTRPAVLLLARSKFMEGRRAFGLEVAS